MQKVTKTFTNEHRKICKISLQKNTSNSLKTKSESLSVNLQT